MLFFSILLTASASELAKQAIQDLLNTTTDRPRKSAPADIGRLVTRVNPTIKAATRRTDPTSEVIPYHVSEYAKCFIRLKEQSTLTTQQREIFDKHFNRDHVDQFNLETLILAIQASEWHGWNFSYSPQQEKRFKTAKTLAELRNILFEEASIMAEKRKFLKTITPVHMPDANIFTTIQVPYRGHRFITTETTTEATVKALMRTQNILGLSRDLPYIVTEVTTHHDNVTNQKWYDIFHPTTQELLCQVNVSHDSNKLPNLISTYRMWPWGDLGTTHNDRKYRLALTWYDRLFDVQGPHHHHYVSFLQPTSGIELCELEPTDITTQRAYYVFGELFGRLIKYNQGSKPLFHGTPSTLFNVGFAFNAKDGRVKFNPHTNTIQWSCMGLLSSELELALNVNENNIVFSLRTIFENVANANPTLCNIFMEGFSSNWGGSERQQLKQYFYPIILFMDPFRDNPHSDTLSSRQSVQSVHSITDSTSSLSEFSERHRLTSSVQRLIDDVESLLSERSGSTTTSTSDSSFVLKGHHLGPNAHHLFDDVEPFEWDSHSSSSTIRTPKKLSQASTPSSTVRRFLDTTTPHDRTARTIRSTTSSSGSSTVLSEWFVPPTYTPTVIPQEIEAAIHALAPDGFIAGVNPKRSSIGFTDQEKGIAAAIMQLAPDKNINGYLTALMLVFSPERANALLTKIFH